MSLVEFHVLAFAYSKYEAQGLPCDAIGNGLLTKQKNMPDAHDASRKHAPLSVSPSPQAKHTCICNPLFAFAS